MLDSIYHITLKLLRITFLLEIVNNWPSFTQHKMDVITLC